MKITRQIVAEKITDYLHGKLSQAELVDWAEHAMMDADFEDATRDFTDHRSLVLPRRRGFVGYKKR